jgi:hypothetical protein
MSPLAQPENMSPGKATAYRFVEYPFLRDVIVGKDTVALRTFDVDWCQAVVRIGHDERSLDEKRLSACAAEKLRYCHF